MEPRLVKCFFYRVVVRESIEASNKLKKVLNIDYRCTINSTNIDRAKKQMKNNKQTKSLNQSTINQSKYKSFRPAWYLAKILNKRK